jgi:hypothetical protein
MHPERNGVNTCNQCGEWLCEDCTVEINGRIFCRGCLAQLAGPKDAPRDAARTAAKPKHISGVLLFLFSFVIPVPGVNYMYMGLIKRGLTAMVGFFLLIYLLSVFNAWPFSLIFGLAIPVYWLTCMFDGYNIRRRINAGEAVYDDVEDILSFLKRNKNLIIGFIVVIVAISLISTVFAILSPILPILIVGLGLYVLFKRPKS